MVRCSKSWALQKHTVEIRVLQTQEAAPEAEESAAAADAAEDDRAE